MAPLNSTRLLKKVEKTQYRALRYVYNDFTASYAIF